MRDVQQIAFNCWDKHCMILLGCVAIAIPVPAGRRLRYSIGPSLAAKGKPGLATGPSLDGRRSPAGAQSLCYTSRAFDSPASARGPRSCGCFDAIDSPSKRPAIAGRAPSLRPRGDRACGFIRAASATICNRSCTLTCQTTRTTPLVRSTMQPAHRPREDVPELLQ